MNEFRAIESIPVDVLGHFSKDLTKLNGENHEPDSLTGFQRGINRHLQIKRSGIAFATSRATLRSCLKEAVPF